MTTVSQRIYAILLASLLAVTAFLTGPGPALAQQDATLPAPRLTAQASERTVELTWTAVAGAARYELWSWWDTDPGWQQIGGDNLTATAYTHSSLVAGITYFYQIRAVDAGGEAGAWSDEISATTPPALDAPTLTAQAAAAAVELTWTAVDTAERYILWSWWDVDTGWQQLGGDNLTATSYTHADLTAGTTYFYQIRAVNAAGELSPLSQQVSATAAEAQQATSTPTPSATATPTPDPLHITTATPTPDPLHTTTPTPTPDPLHTATPTPTPDPLHTSTATPTPDPLHTATPTSTPGATLSPTPTPTATPTDAATATATPTVEAQALTAPSLTAQDTGGAVELSWTAVAGAVRYELFYWTSAEGWKQLGGDNLTATSYTHSDPEVGTTYYYTVRGVNAAGQGGPWAEYVPVTISAGQAATATPTPTSTPMPLSAPTLSVSLTENTIELNWDAVAGAVRYVLWTHTDYSGIQRLDNGNLTATTFTHEGVEAGTTYYYTLRAVSGTDNVSPWSPWVPATLPGPLTLTPAQIFEKVSPAIAYVEAGPGSGSGFLIEGGYLVTAAHVVWPENVVRVVFPDGTEFPRVPVQRMDLIADLAVLGPLNVTVEPLTMIDGESLPIGSRVHFIGYPGEYELFPEPTITGGLLSRLREWEGGGLTLIQSDATIVPGQSGGALFSDTGDVIGISNFGIYGKFGLAVSSTDIMPRIQQLIAGQDPAGLGDRVPPPPGGAFRHSLTLDNYWDDQAYIIHAPPGAEFGFSLLGTNDSVVSIYDFLGINGEVFDTFEITGFEYGAFVFGRRTPNFLIIRQKATTPGNFVIAANHKLVPINDPDSGRTIQVGQSIHGNMDYPSDADYYILNLQQGQTVEILAQSLLNDMFLTLSLRGSPSPSATISRDDGAGLLLRDSRMVIRAPVTASYYLIVETYEPEAAGGYILTVNPVSID